MYGKQIIFSDAVSQQNWFLVKGWNLTMPVTECKFNPDLYNRCKAIYQKYNCWTWWSPDIKEMRLYYG
jgi:hypothetical protein